MNLNTSPLPDTCAASIFYPVFGFSAYFLNDVVMSRNVLWNPFYQFLILWLVFFMPIPRVAKMFSVFFLKSFPVLGFTF